MIVVVSDTHSTEGHRLTDRTLEAVREAELVIHAGDFVTESALDAFEDVATELVAVHGNADDEGVQRRLPRTQTVDFEKARIVVTHFINGDETARSLFGRERGADLVITGHSHRPSVTYTGTIGLLNPGSHATPRGYRPSHAELWIDGPTVGGQLSQPDGTVFDTFTFDS